jgi:hypothetical protein
MGTRTRSPCFGQLQADVQAHHHQHRAGEKRQAPAPAEELRIAQIVGHHQECRDREDQAQGRAELRKHAEPGVFAERRILRGEQYRAAPLAAETNALADAA